MKKLTSLDVLKFSEKAGISISFNKELTGASLNPTLSQLEVFACEVCDFIAGVRPNFKSNINAAELIPFFETGYSDENSEFSHEDAVFKANRALSENLALIMNKLDMTQVDLAAKSGVSQASVSNYLKIGKRVKVGERATSVKLAELAKLASALGVDLWVLLRPVDKS